MVIFNVQKSKKVFVFVVVACFVFSLVSGLAVVFGQQLDTSVVSMSGVGWSLKVDEELQTDSVKSQISVSSAKAGAEKEISVVLNSLADVPDFQVQFKVQTVGLSVYKQLPLDKELNVSGYDFVNATVAMRKDEVVVYRPENVVNSFACFDSSGQKVLHIYASRLVDAVGSEVWVDSDLVYGVLIVYCPEDWLKTAVFPVVVDPVFGYSTKGGSNANFIVNDVKGSLFALAENGNVTSISCYLQYIDSYYPNVTFALYSDLGGYPDVLLTNSSAWQVSGSYDAWKTLAVNVSLTAGNYWLFCKSDNNVNFYYDSGAANQYTYGNEVGDFSSTYWEGHTQAALVMSIYANYTVLASPTPTPTAVSDIVTTGNTLGFVFFLTMFILQIVLILLGRSSVLLMLFGLFGFLLATVNLTALVNLGLPVWVWLFDMFVSAVCLFAASKYWRE